MDNNNYKRQYRQLNDTTKQKISQSLRGRTKSATHSQAISNGLKKYWATVPNQPNNNENKNEEHEYNIRFKYRCVEARSSNISSVIWTYKMGSGTTITVNFAVNVLLGQ